MAADGGEEALDDRKDENEEREALDERRGVDSEGGGSVPPVRASRLQTGQKVLHDVSQASTHIA